MLKPKVFLRASWLINISVQILITFSAVSGKVENSFQSSQYSQYKDPYYASTPNYPYADLTVKTGESSSPAVGETHHQDPLLVQGSGQQPVVNGAPNQHVYYYETYPMHDTSRGSAYVPERNKRCYNTGNGNMRCYSRQDGGNYNASINCQLFSWPYKNLLWFIGVQVLGTMTQRVTMVRVVQDQEAWLVWQACWV